jgi:hypothetical protein
MDTTKAVEKACKKPSLLEALTWICIWESERVVKQARENETWDTCFRYLINKVMKQCPQEWF